MMSIRAEFWNPRPHTGRAGSRTVSTAAELDELLDALQDGRIGDLALFADAQQFVVGMFEDGSGAIAEWGPDGTYFTDGAGPEHSSSFFQTDFPPDVRVSVRSIRTVLRDLLINGKRSDAVSWKPAPAPEITSAEQEEFAAIFDGWPDAR